ncbi:MAG: hypothetical protein Q8934_10780 [Bacillota bacterium]|nr:hypothetical protein [Bacillota bacterium]
MKQIREEIGEEAFKFAAVKIIAKGYNELTNWRILKKDRIYILERTN